MRTRMGLALLAVLFAATGCDLDLVNPNSPTEESVLDDPNQIISLAVGMQSQYAGSINTFVRGPALITDEWAPWTNALAEVRNLYAGGEIDPAFSIVAGPYQATYRIIRSANNLIEFAPQVGLEPGMEAGIVALARLHKAMALGMIIQQYERVPIDADVEGAVPQPREVVLDTVLGLLHSARAELQGVSSGDLSGFRQRVLDPGIDLQNTIDAMIARYSLIAEDYEQAIEAAERVDLGTLSTYSYTGTDVNPVYNYHYGARYVAPLQSFAREAEPGDERVGHWTDTTQVDTTEAVVVEMNRYSNRNAPFPVYLPDEMRLIQAEAHTRLGNLERARDLINEVRTQCDPVLNEPAACLPPLTAEDLPDAESILAQIAYERRYELFQQGLRWEDLRRLGQFTGEEPKAEFLPLPQTECLINPNVTC